MRFTFFSVLMASALSVSGYAQGNRTAATAQQLRANLVDFDREVRQASDEIRRRQGGAAYVQYQHVSRATRSLLQIFDSGFIRNAQMGRTAIVSREYERSKRSYQDLTRAVAGIHRLPWDLRDQFSRVQRSYTELGRQLSNNGGNRPDRGRYVGTCRVVLETAFGHDLRDFYGTARADTANLATIQARENGLSQCRRHISGFQKCTVASECGAERIRGGWGH